MGITYPINKERELGFRCFWEGEKASCFGEHCSVDCGVDVLLARLVDVFTEVLARDGDYDNAGGDGSVRLTWRNGRQDEECSNSNGLVEKEGKMVAELRRGRILQGIYDLVKRGEFEYNASDVVYKNNNNYSYYGADRIEDEDEHNEQDAPVLERLREGLRAELDCQVCYSLILDPLTIRCGHTFCRKCVASVLDHSNLCPVCRRSIDMSLHTVKSASVNSRISGLLDILFADEISAGQEEEEKSEDTDNTMIPLAVCTLSFPMMPTYLHIFEPRYRLLIRRVIQNGEGKFGMLNYNHSGEPQGQLGRTEFMQYGTLVTIERLRLLDDGRMLLLTRGLSRFKVIEWKLVDGYHVGKTERVDDISLADEENMEITETASALASRHGHSDDGEDDSNNHGGSGDDPIATEMPLDSMSTQQLFHIVRDFVRRQAVQGAPWIRIPMPLAFPERPPADLFNFLPWWLAAFLRMPEEERYQMLRTNSVRERLKIAAKWSRNLDSTEWYVQSIPKSIIHTYHTTAYTLTNVPGPNPY